MFVHARTDSNYKVVPAQQELVFDSLYKREPKIAQLDPHTRSSLPSRSSTRYVGDFLVTAYDLSEESCGKLPSASDYGITRSGLNVAHQSRQQAMVVAVDPSVIPLGSRVSIIFPDRPHYDGIYLAADIGSKVKQNHLDLFIGDFPNSKQEAERFGRTSARVFLLE